MIRAVRFLVLSNFSLYGKMDTLRLGCTNPKATLLEALEPSRRYMGDAYFTCCDFREFFGKLEGGMGERAFVYADPPYLGTVDTYSHSFAEADSEALFDTLQASGLRFAMSEFDHPFIREQATRRGLTVVDIMTGKNLTSSVKKTEVLVVNYITPQLKLF